MSNLNKHWSEIEPSTVKGTKPIYSHVSTGFANRRRETAIAKALCTLQRHYGHYLSLIAKKQAAYKVNTVPNKVIEQQIAKVAKDYYAKWWILNRKLGHTCLNQIQSTKIVDLRDPFIKVQFSFDELAMLTGLASDRRQATERWSFNNIKGLGSVFQRPTWNQWCEDMINICKKVQSMQKCTDLLTLDVIERKVLIRITRHAIITLKNNAASNYALDGEIKDINPEYRRDKYDGESTHKKYTYYDLCEIGRHRSIERLMMFWRGQMREDERETLIRLARAIVVKLTPDVKDMPYV